MKYSIRINVSSYPTQFRLEEVVRSREDQGLGSFPTGSDADDSAYHCFRAGRGVGFLHSFRPIESPA